MKFVSAARHRFTREQLVELQRAYHDDGDLEARERLIEAYLPLVRSLARSLANRGEGIEDLVQVGSIGLIKAVDRFEPGRGVDLAVFAAPNILGEMRRHLRDRCAVIRIPRRNQAASDRPRVVQLADDAEQLAAEEEVFRPSEDRVVVETGLRRLHWRERQAVTCRFFADMSQLEIASRLGISQPQASRLLASGLAKLRADLDANAEVFASRGLNSWHGDSRRRHGRAA
jgi:RNA polymerase sigma-B factor